MTGIEAREIVMAKYPNAVAVINPHGFKGEVSCVITAYLSEEVIDDFSDTAAKFAWINAAEHIKSEVEG